MADRHVLEVSDEVHGLVMGLIGACAEQGVPVLPPPDPARELAATRRRCMLDVSYVGSPLVGHAGGAAGAPGPGQRFRDRVRLRGTGHHLLVFGAVPRLDDFRARWGKLVPVVDATDARFDATEAGVPDGGVVLVRPDGFIGFRAAPADAASIQALDEHLSGYLIPTPPRS
jgi:6-methylpretetramide 4-monooxygenase / 4-hydroxy-6-methylpretetramide 12a-monooxygenase